MDSDLPPHFNVFKVDLTLLDLLVEELYLWRSTRAAKTDSFSLELLSLGDHDSANNSPPAYWYDSEDEAAT
jgi:hypothetical protein